MTYLLDSLFVIGILISLYEFLFTNGYNLSDFLINAVLIYVIVTTVYFLIKTKDLYKIKKLKKTEILDSDIFSIRVPRFKYGIFLSISNILYGAALISYFFYTLYIYPIRELYGNELLRFFVIAITIFYGVLKILYSIKIINLFRVKPIKRRNPLDI